MLAPQWCWLSARCHRPLVPSCTALRIDMMRFCSCAPVCCQSELAAPIGDAGCLTHQPCQQTTEAQHHKHPPTQPIQPTSQLHRQHANRTTDKHRAKCHISISQPDVQPAHQEPVSDIPLAGQTPRQIRNRKPTCLAAGGRHATGRINHHVSLMAVLAGSAITPTPHLAASHVGDAFCCRSCCLLPS